MWGSHGLTVRRVDILPKTLPKQPGECQATPPRRHTRCGAAAESSVLWPFLHEEMEGLASHQTMLPSIHSDSSLLWTGNRTSRLATRSPSAPTSNCTLHDLFHHFCGKRIFSARSQRCMVRTASNLEEEIGGRKHQSYIVCNDTMVSILTI